MSDDPRRRTPRADVVLAAPEVRSAVERLGRDRVKRAVTAALEACRRGEVEPDRVTAAVLAGLPASATSLRAVVNATGVVVHTNLGRAPLSAAAVEAVRVAAGPTDVELDLATGRRGSRGAGALAALAAAVPDAGGVHVVNNGAAALALVSNVLGRDREVVVSRGELVEIGDGFRIPDLVESTGARLREVGTTNRAHLEDYADAVTDRTAFVLKVHPSNFRVVGFTSSVEVSALSTLGVPVVADIGSGLLRPHPRLPDEPDAASTLRAGAALVTASGDKLLGGPQCGLLLGERELVERLRRHPFARALRVDKLTLAALEASLDGPATPVAAALATRPADLLARARRLADALGADLSEAVPSQAAVGGGGAPGSSWTVRRSRCRSRWPSRCVGESPRSWVTSSRGGCCWTCSASRSTSTRCWSARSVARWPTGPLDVHVIATAGHVDHGKSTLVAALTGMEPDRLEEEHRRGLSIQLGYCWTSLPGVGDVAFVDVPGHERFVTTTLSGLGPVPTVLLVVAADDPWMPQAREHLAALDALGVSRGLLVVTRRDLADPGPATARARSELAGTSLADVASVAVSARTGDGLDELRGLLGELLLAADPPSGDADVRLWVDRRFHVRGAGTVVTGTLPAGTVRVGEALSADDDTVRVRGIESLGRTEQTVSGVARVALNLGGPVPASLTAGSTLVTPGAFEPSSVLDVRLTVAGRLPERPMLHVGSAAVAVRTRRLDDRYVRLSLARPLPLRIGDRVLLRDPGSRAVWGADVVDPAPPSLRRRGASALRAEELAGADGSVAAELDRRGSVRRDLLVRLGVDLSDPPAGTVEAGGWLVSPAAAAALRERLAAVVGDAGPGGVPTAQLAHTLDLPDERLVHPLVPPPLRVENGRVLTGQDVDLPPLARAALDALTARLTADPFAAPDAELLRALPGAPHSVATLVRAGLLVRVADGVHLLPGADDEAVDRLRALPQPFTVSEARTALATSRRVVLPLLARLDRAGRTLRLPDDRRRVR